jgi:hypothetical protein
MLLMLFLDPKGGKKPNLRKELSNHHENLPVKVVEFESSESTIIIKLMNCNKLNDYIESIRRFGCCGRSRSALLVSLSYARWRQFCLQLPWQPAVR